jgi:hypothetical protein
LSVKFKRTNRGATIDVGLANDVLGVEPYVPNDES